MVSQNERNVNAGIAVDMLLLSCLHHSRASMPPRLEASGRYSLFRLSQSTVVFGGTVQLLDTRASAAVVVTADVFSLG